MSTETPVPKPITPERLRGILDPCKLPLPEELPVGRIHSREGLDHSGEPAIFTTVVFKPGVRDSGLDGKALLDVTRVIRGALQAEGIELFPYVTFLTDRDAQTVPSLVRETLTEEYASR
jgi:hypothetical protein